GCVPLRAAVLVPRGDVVSCPPACHAPHRLGWGVHGHLLSRARRSVPVLQGRRPVASFGATDSIWRFCVLAAKAVGNQPNFTSLVLEAYPRIDPDGTGRSEERRVGQEGTTRRLRR